MSHTCSTRCCELLEEKRLAGEQHECYICSVISALADTFVCGACDLRVCTDCGDLALSLCEDCLGDLCERCEICQSTDVEEGSSICDSCWEREQVRQLKRCECGEALSSHASRSGPCLQEGCDCRRFTPRRADRQLSAEKVAPWWWTGPFQATEDLVIEAMSHTRQSAQRTLADVELFLQEHRRRYTTEISTFTNSDELRGAIIALEVWKKHGKLPHELTAELEARCRERHELWD